MRMVRAAENAVSIWFSEEGVPPRRRMLALVRRALESEGYEPWPETEAECFEADGEALVIARPARARRGYRFPDLDALLIGARGCADGDSALYLDAGGDYILTLPPSAVSNAMREFGVPCSVSPDWEAHAREQGLCLIPEDAAADLCRLFSP